MKQKIRQLFTHCSSRITHHGSGGFTLIELAMVLVVIGIVITIGVNLVGPLTKRMRVNESRDIVNAAVESVTSWASSNKRLPTAVEFPSVVKAPTDAFTTDLLYIVDH
ncbi:MAG: type II secretion system GspH family protein [Nitrospirae bacterium]|nr:type II secretion system GspH family protein [Nitrospirota bacterium]MCL5977965.1 type II secretion system GspH family protein [Nitrospirota bacterium]